MTYTIQQIPLEDRPRERLAASGVESVTNTELIAIILGSGMKGKSVLDLARDLLVSFGGLSGLANASIHELCTVKGMGQAKAVQLKAALALGMRSSLQKGPIRPCVQTPDQAFQLLQESFLGETREKFVVLLLDVKSRLIGIEVVAIGTLNETLVHPRELFHLAIRQKAAAIIVAHNHPSGDVTPSKEDIDLTHMLVDAGKLLSIPVQDHLIVAGQEYRSLRKTGVAF